MADPTMGGPGGRPPSPIDQNLGLAGHGGATQTWGQIFTEILNFWPIFCTKNYKKLSASGGLAPLTLQRVNPLGAPPPDPHLGSRSSRSPWSPLGKSWIRH